MSKVRPINSVTDDAKAAVKISKYPPLGCRSMTGQMPIFVMRGMAVDQTIEFCNKSGSTVFAMIESRDAVERADEIAAVEGVDVVLVGSMDLTIDLGSGGQFDKPEYRYSLEKISQACRAHGKVLVWRASMTIRLCRTGLSMGWGRDSCLSSRTLRYCQAVVLKQSRNYRV